MRSFTTKVVSLLALSLQSSLVRSASTQSAAIATPTTNPATITAVSIKQCPTNLDTPEFKSADACKSKLGTSYYGYCNSGEGQCECWFMTQEAACFESWCPGYSTRFLYNPNPETQAVNMMVWESQSASCAATPGLIPSGAVGGGGKNNGGVTLTGFPATSGVTGGGSIAAATGTGTATGTNTGIAKSGAGRNGEIGVWSVVGGLVGVGVLMMWV